MDVTRAVVAARGRGKGGCSIEVENPSVLSEMTYAIVSQIWKTSIWYTRLKFIQAKVSIYDFIYSSVRRRMLVTSLPVTRFVSSSNV